MTKKGKKDKVEEMCVIFVEGDADELIINRLLDYYKDNGWSRPKGIRVFNTHGTPIWRNMRVGLTPMCMLRVFKSNLTGKKLESC